MSEANETRWLSEEEQQLWRHMIAASVKITRGIDDALREVSDLSSPEYAVMVSLSEAPEGEIRLRDLCVQLGWDRSRASHQITRMEKRGLVSKCTAKDDSRGVLVSLTEDGWRRLEVAVPDHVETVRRLVFDHTGEQDHAGALRFLRAIVEAE